MNRLKAALAAGRVQTGLWLDLASADVAEMAGGAGFDWCLIDGEHGPNELRTILEQLRALDAAGCEAVVRVARNDPVRLGQVLDLGARSVMVPMVDSPEAAAAAVAACRYPPAGRRGMGAMVARASRWGQDAGYGARAAEDVCVIVQAESRQAMAALAGIATVDGVDGVFVGPADLAADLGYPGRADHPEVRAVIEAGVATIRGAGKSPGMLTFDEGDIADWARLGVTMLGVGADSSLLRSALGALAGSARAATS